LSWPDAFLQKRKLQHEIAYLCAENSRRLFCKLEIHFYNTRMLYRLLRPELLKRIENFPAVAMVGPRQCGKTTLAQSLRGEYFDLEQESERLRADLGWDSLVAGKSLVVFDEGQSWPELFRRLRGAIDRDRKRNGRFLLLGSVSPSLMVHVSQSLAGRLSLVELTPLLWSELTTKASQERRWLCGGYPDGGVLDSKSFPRWELDYLTLIVQRDLPNWGLPSKPQTTDRLIRMLAALHGQTWNASQVGQSLGLSYQTVNSYVDYLAGAFLIRRLPPYQTNMRKRLVKSPRVYWRDSGLLHALLNVADDRSLLSQPWVGASWEGFVIETLIGELSSRGVAFTPYYFRTSDRHELDLVLDFGHERWAVEVKLTASPSPADMDRLNKTADMIHARRRFLVTKTTKPAGDGTRGSENLVSLLRLVDESF
jgi:predicted AAA+ superfamily ATPase